MPRQGVGHGQPGGREEPGVVDQAVTSSANDYSSTLLVLVFFVLGGIVFVRFAY